MAPPELAADTPVLDVLQPHVVNLLKALWHNLNVSISDSLWAAFQEIAHAENRGLQARKIACAYDQPAPKMSLSHMMLVPGLLTKTGAPGSAKCNAIR